MVILSATGTSTMIVGTEVTVYNPSTMKRFDGYVDLTPMASDDTVEMRVYVLLDTLGAYIQYNVQSFTGVQTPNALKYIPTLPSDIGYKITLKQTAGATAKVFRYRIYEV